MSWLVFALVFVVVLPVAESFRERTPSRRRRFLTSALDQTQLVIDTETWASLDRYAARRAQWGAFGRGIGFGIGIAVSLWLMMRGATDALTLLPVATSLVGYAIGAALSSQHRSTLSSAEERVSALQPQGLREYLRRRVLATEVGCGILGLLAAGVGVLVLTSDLLEFPGLAPLLPLGLMVIAAFSLLVRRPFDKKLRPEQTPVVSRLVGRSRQA